MLETPTAPLEYVREGIADAFTSTRRRSDEFQRRRSAPRVMIAEHLFHGALYVS